MFLLKVSISFQGKFTVGHIYFSSEDVAFLNSVSIELLMVLSKSSIKASTGDSAVSFALMLAGF